MTVAVIPFLLLHRPLLQWFNEMHQYGQSVAGAWHAEKAGRMIACRQHGAAYMGPHYVSPLYCSIKGSLSQFLPGLESWGHLLLHLNAPTPNTCIMVVTCNRHSFAFYFSSKKLVSIGDPFRSKCASISSRESRDGCGNLAYGTVSACAPQKPGFACY